MELQLSGRTALVTGASAGIGRAIAQALATGNVRVCIAARRHDALEATASEIAAKGHPRPHVFAIDITAAGAPQRLAAEAATAIGPIDILVNSAGGGSGKTPLQGPTMSGHI